ncbi:MAG: GNAT family N-acetyltransferase, partial [Planctomycetales bacterium]|nr:GNAT family N-acetyltransferase [Planctomycetales bacterium]
KKQPSDNLHLEFYPLTMERWADFEALFGERGACGGCWCMWWRLKRAQFEQQKGEDNRRAMQAIVKSGQIPGILAYSQNQPLAWCSVALREQFPVLARSRIFKPIDDEPVWSITCFFIEKSSRKKGLSAQMINAAVDFVKKNGGRIVEAYPVAPQKDKTADAFVWTGLASSFVKAGFVECARRSATRPMMRYYLQS